MIRSQVTLGIFSVVLTLISYGRYFWNVYRKKTKPHLFSWFVWFLIVVISFFAQRTEDTGPGTWLLGVDSMMCLMCTMAAYFRGEKDIKKSDWVAFLGALAAIPLWVMTGDPLGAVLLVSFIDFLAFYPTFRKSWNKPWEETLFTYGLCALTFSLSVLALETRTLVTALYPLTIIVTNGTFVLMVLWRRRCHQKNTNMKPVP